MVFGIYGIIKDNGKVIKLIEKNALRMEDFQGKGYYLWSDRGNLYHIKYNHFARQTLKGEYIARMEINSTPPDAKIPEKLKELIKKYEYL